MTARWSLKRRLTIAVVSLVAVVFIGLAPLLYVAVRHGAYLQHDAALAGRARALAEIAEYEDGDYEMPLPPEPRDAPPSYIEVWRPDGAVLARSPSLGSDDLVRTFVRTDGRLAYRDVILPDGRDGRAIAMRFVPRGGAGPLVLVLAEGIADAEAALASVRMWFYVLGGAALIAIAMVTAWSLGRGLAPLARLAAEIERIDDRRLATRLSLDGQPLEIEIAVRKLNELLARLDASFARERQFTADVSHELRTPIAGLRTLLEVTALTDRQAAEYRTAVADALAIVQQLGTVVENLLALARLDAGHVEIDAREFALRTLVDDCWRPHAALAAERAIEFRNAVPHDARAHTDREKLRIVVGNLLANAAEYTERGGWIEVATAADGMLDVADSGPPLPLPADQVERVFDRLWRSDASRSATGVHCGIGLSLSRALCAALSLSLTAQSSVDGVRFRIS